jgi:hypothetical protein
VLPDEKYNWAFGIKIRKAGGSVYCCFFFIFIFFFFIVLLDENYDWAFWN